jgi:hypothetical protein
LTAAICFGVASFVMSHQAKRLIRNPHDRDGGDAVPKMEALAPVPPTPAGASHFEPRQLARSSSSPDLACIGEAFREASTRNPMLS